MDARPHTAPVDRVFAEPMEPIPDFAFDHQVTHVFDDMIERSVPFYRRVNDLCADHVLGTHPSVVVDLGCSTGSLLRSLCDRAPKASTRLFGVDASRPMIERAEQKLRGVAQATLTHADVRRWQIPHADAIVANYTLQFIAPEDRSAILARVHRALRPGGLLVLSEKLCHPDPRVQELYNRVYHAYKRRRGYSRVEIEQKRVALEGVLRPWSLDRNIEALERAGFGDVRVVHRWVNFATLVATT